MCVAFSAKPQSFRGLRFTEKPWWVSCVEFTKQCSENYTTYTNSFMWSRIYIYLFLRFFSWIDTEAGLCQSLVSKFVNNRKETIIEVEITKREKIILQVQCFNEENGSSMFIW